MDKKLVPCANKKCKEYNPRFKCGCDSKTFLSVVKCKDYKPSIEGEKDEIQK